MIAELLTQEQRNRRNYIHKAGSPGNATLNRRTQPNGRNLKTILGYNTITTCLSQDIVKIGDIELSGSTFQRFQTKKRKDEIKQAAESKEEIEAKIRAKTDANGKYFREIYNLRNVAHCKQRFKKRVSPKLFKRGMSLRFLSQRSKGKIRDKGTALSRCLGSKQTFCTLTFINDITDSRAIAILNNFFNTLRKRFGKINYWWVAERQDNGRIHFHIILNKFLPVRQYNALWILSQYNAGIEAPGISFDKISLWILLDELNPERKSILQKHLNPFDIKKITTINRLSYYLTKYVTKNKNAGFGCAAWHCTRAVSRIFTKTAVSRSTLSQASDPKINSSLNKKTGELIAPKPILGKFHQLFYINNKLFFLPNMAVMEEINGYILNDELDFEGLYNCLN